MSSKVKILASSLRPIEGVNSSIVVPVFNESESVKFFVNSIANLFHNLMVMLSEIIFINDGSIDDTLEIPLA